MNILLSNDDGFDAPGLRALERALAGLGTLWTIAPQLEQSAKSHALTMRDAIRVTRRGERQWDVSGTPADCVYLGVHGLLPVRPDVVVSGINAGTNLATDVYYSGTVAAAREATCMGIRALAASLWIEPGQPAQWDAAGAVVRGVVERIVTLPREPDVLYNLNVPNRAQPLGVRVARLGRRHYQALVDARTDPRGRPYYWIGGDHDRFEGGPDTDGPLCEAGWATLTPLQLEHTADRALDALHSLWPAPGTSA